MSQKTEWEKGACYTFFGAGRVFWSYMAAFKCANGARVRRFDTRTDAEQWLFAVGVLVFDKQ